MDFVHFQVTFFCRIFLWCKRLTNVRQERARKEPLKAGVGVSDNLEYIRLLEIRGATRHDF